MVVLHLVLTHFGFCFIQDPEILIHTESAFLLLIKPCMEQQNGSGVNLCPRTLSLIAPLTKIKKQITRSSSEANSMFTHSR